MDGFGIVDMLRKDYKQWDLETPSGQRVVYGIASVISSYDKCRLAAAGNHAARKQGQQGAPPADHHLQIMRRFAEDLKLDVCRRRRVCLLKRWVVRCCETFTVATSFFCVSQVLAVMFLVVDKSDVSRQLLLHVSGAAVRDGKAPAVLELREAANESIPATAEALFDQSAEESIEAQTQDFVLLRQLNSLMSRKKVQPALHKVLQQFVNSA